MARRRRAASDVPVRPPDPRAGRKLHWRRYGAAAPPCRAALVAATFGLESTNARPRNHTSAIRSKGVAYVVRSEEVDMRLWAVSVECASEAGWWSEARDDAA